MFIDRLRRSWKRCAALCDEPGAGVDLRTVFDVDTPEDHHEDRWLDIGLPTEDRCVDALPLPGPARPGRIYRSLFLETPRFLPWLVERIGALGATIQTKPLNTLEDVAGLQEAVVVNCLGFGARDVFGDSQMQGARGQLVLMTPQPMPYVLQHGWTYMFARKDALVLGGTFEPGVTTPTPDEHDCRRILHTHRAFFDQSLTEQMT